MSLTIGALRANTIPIELNGAEAPGSAAPADKDAQAPAAADSSSSVELSPEALSLIGKLKARDTQVRQHEQAHLAAAGGLATSGATYTYQRGPDGINYAVGGEVHIDTSPGRTPEDTIARAQAIIAAALAPADPSGADRAVAAQAQQMAAQARAQLQSAAPAAQRGNSASQADSVRRAYGLEGAAEPSIDVSA
jgi:hypothetical protein